MGKASPLHWYVANGEPVPINAEYYPLLEQRPARMHGPASAAALWVPGINGTEAQIAVMRVSAVEDWPKWVSRLAEFVKEE